MLWLATHKNIQLVLTVKLYWHVEDHMQYFSFFLKPRKNVHLKFLWQKVHPGIAYLTFIIFGVILFKVFVFLEVTCMIGFLDSSDIRARHWQGSWQMQIYKLLSLLIQLFLHWYLEWIWSVHACFYQSFLGIDYDETWLHVSLHKHWFLVLVGPRMQRRLSCKGGNWSQAPSLFVLTSIYAHFLGAQFWCIWNEYLTPPRWVWALCA